MGRGKDEAFSAMGYDIMEEKGERMSERERKFGISLFLVNFTSTRDLTYVAIACSSNMILAVGPTLFSYYVVIQRTFRNNENHTRSQAFIEVLRRYRSAVESASAITL